jgi:hypothetical protein
MSGANYTRVWQIHAVLHPRPDDLISTSRFFIREGELYVWNERKRKKQLRYFFLFNDIMLLTKRESHKRFWLRIHITLRSPYVSVEDIDNSSYNQEIRLHCRSRSFILYAPSDDLRREWIDDIRASIAGTHKEEMDNKEAKKKNDEVISVKNEQTGKVVAPTLSQVGKKPPRDDDSDDGVQRRKSKSRKGQNQPPLLLGDVFEYPSQPGQQDMVRPGGAYVQSSPGAFSMNSAGNPFLGSGPGQSNPFGSSNQFLALTMGSQSGSSPFLAPSPAANPFGSAQLASNPFALVTTPQSNPFGFNSQQAQPAPVNPFAPQPQASAFGSQGGLSPNPFGQQPQPQAANPFF